MYEATYRIVLMVRKPMPGDTFDEALAAARKIIEPSYKTSILTSNGRVKGEVDDWGIHLVGIDEAGGYNTD